MTWESFLLSAFSSSTLRQADDDGETIVSVDDGNERERKSGKGQKIGTW